MIIYITYKSIAKLHMGKSYAGKARAFCLLLVILISAECLHQPTACDQPKIVEYIFNYTMPTNDLKTLIT